MKKSYLVALGAVAVAAIVLFVVFTPSPAERFATQVAQDFQAGDLEAALLHLEEWADNTADGIDRTAIMSLHMAVSIAQVVRDAQLLVEYEALNMMLADPDGFAGGVADYGQSLEYLRDQLRRDQERLLQTAKAYHGQHYRSGLRIQSPVNGILDLVQGEEKMLEAYRALLAGDASDSEHEAFHAGVAREALGAVLQLVIIQPEGQSRGQVALTGGLDLAELWWLIAAHSTEAHLSETALGIVLAETERQPDHPARARAEAALREVRRFG